MKNFYITGISGTGKTTIANILKEKGIQAYSIDEVPKLCFWVNKNDEKIVDYEAKLDQTFINSNKWICDVKMLKDILNQEGKVVMLGHTENEKDFLNLFDKIILLRSKPETFLKRILERKDNDFGKEKTVQEYLLKTYQEFESDVLDRGAVSVDADEPLDIVVNNIISEIQ